MLTNSKPSASPSQTGSNPRSNGRRVLIAGATGLIGNLILEGLLRDPSVAEVHALSRRQLVIRHPKLTTHVVDFRAIPPLPPLDEIYLALGTTIRQAGSREAFRAVDFDANLAVAKAGMAAGAGRIGLVSAMSANTQSSLFYTRVKGELEEALEALSPETLMMVRPSFLIGDRRNLNQPTRYGEKIGVWLNVLLKPVVPRDYRPIEAPRVARLLLSTVPALRGKKTWQYREIECYEREANFSASDVRSKREQS